MTVYKLTVAQTVEERILDLQAKKRELAEQAIESGAKNNALKLTINDMMDLFKPSHGHGKDTAPKLPAGPLGSSKPRAQGQGLLRKGREENAVFGRRW